MRKILLVLSVLALLTTAVSTANAQNEIILAGSSNYMTFTGTGGGNWTLNMTGLTGEAKGLGIMTSSKGSYTITQTGTIKGTYMGGGLWDITQTGLLTFAYGTFLSGTLELLTLGQAAGTGLVSDFNVNAAVNLTSLSGTLAGDFPSGAIVDITFQLPHSNSLSDLGYGTLTLGTSSGEITRTPEPGSMVLVGSGLILLGGLARRRRRA